MITFTASEMRVITGIQAKNLYNYWKRGHIEKDENKLYPFSKINKQFLAEYGKATELEKVLQEKKKKPAQKNSVTKKKPVAKKATSKKTTKAKPAPKKQPRKKEEELSPLQNVNVIQKELAIEKARVDLQLKKKELSKQSGDLIELSTTIDSIKRYSGDFNRDLLQNIRTFVQDICARHGIESGKMGEYKMKVADIINDSNNKAVDNLLKNFE